MIPSAILLLLLLLGVTVLSPTLGHGQIKDQSRNVRQAPNARAPPPCVGIPQLVALKERFARTIDSNDDGHATFPEIKTFLQKYLPNVLNQVVTDFIRRRDTNHNGKIEFVPEYITDVLSPDYTDEAAKEWFFLEDTNGDSLVSRDELVNIAMKLGFSREQAEEDVDGYYLSVDRDGDAKLSFDEYHTLYTAMGR